MSLKNIQPGALRKLFRDGKFFKQHTYGACPGYLQTNISILPASVADNFKEFCRLNSAPCPLIFKSQPGEVAAPIIGKDIDIRTDLPAYRVIENGEIAKTVADLKDIEWDEMVTFHIGCSFTFDDQLIANGIPLDQNQNICMYKTNISCKEVPPFKTNMYVSLRPIPKDKLKDAVNCTLNTDFAHGAPIHIGNPESIGIPNLSENIMDVKIDLAEDEIPAFWACGITSGYAVKSAGLAQCFAHSPGGMFVSDVLSHNVSDIVPTTLYPEAELLEMKQKVYQILSKPSLDAIRRIENEIMEDIGQRGITNLLVKDDFCRTCLGLAANGDHVGIIFGFPCFEGEDPVEENDGVAGAIYIANALLKLGKSVTFIVDNVSLTLKNFLLEQMPKCQIKSVGTDFTNDNKDFLYDTDTSKPLFSHLLAIERPSPSVDGTCRGMNGRLINVEPTHLLFLQAGNQITTIGIGDGGNELGMGKVRSQIVQHVPKGETTGSTISCDYLVTCGVSNWGGFAVAAGLDILSRCPVFDRYRRFGLGFQEKCDVNRLLYNEEQNEDLSKQISGKGFRDGIRKTAGMSVDNLEYEVHVAKYDKIRRISEDVRFE